VLAYDQTVDREFHLILVIGRELNTRVKLIKNERQKTKPACACPSFFLPLIRVLGWIGAPRSQARQISALVKALGLRLRMTEKTLRGALRKPTNSPQTTAKLVELEQEMIARVKAKLPQELVGKG